MLECGLTVSCKPLLSGNLIGVLKRKIESYYCKKNFHKCARFKLLITGQPVPPTLLPNNKICISCK